MLPFLRQDSNGRPLGAAADHRLAPAVPQAGPKALGLSSCQALRFLKQPIWAPGLGGNPRHPVPDGQEWSLWFSGGFHFSQKRRESLSADLTTGSPVVGFLSSNRVRLRFGHGSKSRTPDEHPNYTKMVRLVLTHSHLNPGDPAGTPPWRRTT